MRVLHVIASLAPQYGGPQAVLPEMCRALTSRGHHVEVFTTSDGQPEASGLTLGIPTSADGFTVTYFPVQRPRRFLTSIPMARALRSRLKEFDVVHIHGLYRFHTLVAAFFCQRFGVPYIIRPHGTLNPYHRGIRRGRKAIYNALVGWRNVNRASAMHYVSPSELKHAEQAGVSGRAFVVPHGVTPALLESEMRDSFARFEEHILVTFLGRLTEKKGLDVLCEAFSLAASEREDIHLAIAGPDEEGIGRAIRERIELLGLHDRVTLVGMVTGSRKAELLTRSAVFVLPSRDENFALAAVEAMAAGIPVVISKGVAIHEEVSRAEAGLVVERSAAAVAEAILTLVNDQALAKNLGENGKRLVRRLFSWDAVAGQLETMYRIVVAPRTNSTATTSRGIVGEDPLDASHRRSIRSGTPRIFGANQTDRGSDTTGAGPPTI